MNWTLSTFTRLTQESTTYFCLEHSRNCSPNYFIIIIPTSLPWSSLKMHSLIVEKDSLENLFAFVYNKLIYKAAYLQILGPSEMINTLIWVKSKFSIWLKNKVWVEGSHSSRPLWLQFPTPQGGNILHKNLKKYWCFSRK